MVLAKFIRTASQDKLQIQRQLVSEYSSQNRLYRCQYWGSLSISSENRSRWRCSLVARLVRKLFGKFCVADNYSLLPSDCPFSCANNRKVSVFTWEMEREIVWHRTMTAARLLLLLLHNINKNISDWKLKIFKLIISRPGAQQPVSRVSKHGRGRGQSRDTAAVKHFSWWVCFYLQLSSSGDARVARQTWAE